MQCEEFSDESSFTSSEKKYATHCLRPLQRKNESLTAPSIHMGTLLLWSSSKVWGHGRVQRAMELTAADLEPGVAQFPSH